MTINYKKQKEEILAINQSLRFLEKCFLETEEKIPIIAYSEGIPLVVRDLLERERNYRILQIRIDSIKEKTGLTHKQIRRLNKTYTLTEIVNGKWEGKKFTIKDLVIVY